mgnify:CR=1 FL=1
MTAVALLARDLETLGKASLAAVAEGDWLAVERFETLRLDLLRRLNSLADEAGLQAQVLDVLHAARRLAEQLAPAIDEQRSLHDAEMRQAEQAARVRQAYTRASMAE